MSGQATKENLDALEVRASERLFDFLIRRTDDHAELVIEDERSQCALRVA